MQIRTTYQEREKRITPGLYDLEFYKQYNYEESKYFKINHYPSERKPDYFRKVFKDIQVLSPVSYAEHSRYEKVGTLKELGKSYHATNRLRGVNYTNNDIYYTVDNNTENRLDKISYMYYGNSNYWWAIAHANSLFDSFKVPRGMVLRIPSFSSIDSKYFN